MDYRLKYIKYKLKYLELKGAGRKRDAVAASMDESDAEDVLDDLDDLDDLDVGHVDKEKRIEYIITNYCKIPFRRAIAEVIPHGLLADKMTNHGLGSGIYGFINKENAIGYTNGYESKTFIIDNPLILENNLKYINDESESDNISYTQLSNILNRTCTKIIKENVDVDALSIEYIESKLISEYFYLQLKENNFKITNIFRTTLDNLIIAIRNFIIDYKLLLSLPREEENYVYMPINYLLYLYDYDGIYNRGGDSGSYGSIKFFFDYSYPSRGYPLNYKHAEPMKGHLIFNNKKILEKKDF